MAFSTETNSTLYSLYENGWWIKVSPLARINPERWICSVYKKGKVSWITEDCKDFVTPELAYQWAFKFIETKNNEK